MKTTTVLVLVALLGFASTLDCEDGWYSFTHASGDDYCTQCAAGVAKCDDTTGAVGDYDEAIDGVDDNLAPLCGISGDLFWKDDDCSRECKEGCSTCVIDYDYCSDCDPGYVWNDDYTCLPSVIGLLAATLAILVVGLVFVVISFMKVNAAAK